MRPIERWRSPDWLTPFGAEGVLAAELRSAEPPRPGPLNRTTVASWLFTPRQWRVQNLGVILDALAATETGDPPVVLGVGDHDEGAYWIAAVSLAMSPGSAREFFFSTRERPGTLADAWHRGVQLACLGRQDLPAVAKLRSVVVIDTATMPELGDLDGSPHRTDRGDEIAVTEWSTLVAELFTDAEAMVRAVDDLDSVAARVGDQELRRIWPLAMVLARRDPSDPAPEAQRVLSAWAPPGLQSHPELLETATAAVTTEIGGDIQQAWALVQRVDAVPDGEKQTARSESQDAPDALADAAVRGYAELALADRQWLAEPGVSRLPSPRHLRTDPDPRLVAIASATLSGFAAHASMLEPEQRVAEGTAALHLVELCLRLGLAHDQDLLQGLWQLCTANLMPCLLDAASAPLLVQQLATDDQHRPVVGQEARGWIWSQLLETPLEHLGPTGARLAPAVLEAFGPRDDDPSPVTGWAEWLRETARRDPRQLTSVTVNALIAELASHELISAGAGSAEPPAEGTTSGRDARLVLAWDRLQSVRPSAPVRAQVAAPETSWLWPAWDTAEVELLTDGFPDAPGEWYWPWLLHEPATEAARRLWQRLSRQSPDALLRAAAGVRLELAAEDWLSAAEPAVAASSLSALSEVAGRVGEGHEEVLDPELGRRGLVGALQLLLLARAESHPSHARTARPTRASFGEHFHDRHSHHDQAASEVQTVPAPASVHTPATVHTPADPAADQSGSWERTAAAAQHTLTAIGAPTSLELTADELTELADWSAQRISTATLTELLLAGDPESPLVVSKDFAAAWLHRVTAHSVEHGDSADSHGPEPVVLALLRERLNRDAQSRDQVGAEVTRAARTAPGSADDRALRSAERYLSGWLRQLQSTRSKWDRRR